MAPGNSSGSSASSATTSACFTTCACCVRSRPITTSIGTVTVAIGGEIERLQRVEAGELLEEAGRRIEAGHDARDRVAPVRKLVLAERQLLPQRGGTVGPARAQQVHRLERRGRCSSAPSRW